MDSSVESKAWHPRTQEECCHSSLHHRHHHHPHRYHLHVSRHCPFHSCMLHFNNHSPICPIFYLHPLLQNPPLSDARNLLPSESKEAVPGTLMMQEENVGVAVEEEEDEPVFVLTDEWRDFAKSEAKRRQEKKQAKKKGKK